jgi:hypothetical protein
MASVAKSKAAKRKVNKGAIAHEPKSTARR